MKGNISIDALYRVDASQSIAWPVAARCGKSHVIDAAADLGRSGKKGFMGKALVWSEPGHFRANEGRGVAFGVLDQVAVPADADPDPAPFDKPSLRHLAAAAEIRSPDDREFQAPSALRIPSWQPDNEGRGAHGQEIFRSPH